MDTIKEDDPTNKSSDESSMKAEDGNCSDIATQELYGDEVANLNDFEEEFTVYENNGSGDESVVVAKEEKTELVQHYGKEEELPAPDFDVLLEATTHVKDVSKGAIPKTFTTRKKKKVKWLFPDSSDSDSDNYANQSEKRYITLSELKGGMLHFDWVLWHSKTAGIDWRKVDNFMFFSDYRHVMCNYMKIYTLPTRMRIGIFKKGIAPIWNSEENKAGGHFVITFFRYDGLDLDTIWIRLVENIVLRNFYDTSEHTVSGVVLETDVCMIHIYVWTNDAAKKNAVSMLQCCLRRDLHLPHDVPIVYVNHTDDQSLLMEVSEPVYV